MAEKKYLDDAGLDKVAQHVNRRLKVVSVMPASADVGATRLYTGATSADYTKGGIYQYNGTDWELISAGAQKAELPIASAELVGTIYQYIGDTTSTRTSGYFYECKTQGTDPETYAWEQVNVQPSSGEGQTIQVSELPTATADNLGTIYQYVGTSVGNYINGYFYKSVALGTTPETYGWESTDTQKVTVIENVTYPPSGTNIKAQFYRSTTGDVWAGDTVSQKTIKLTGKLEETKSLPTLTTELVDTGKCYILTEEQDDYEIGSIYKATAEKIWLSQNEEKNYNVFTSSGAFNETGVAPMRKWTPKNSTMFFATNPTSFRKVSYFDQANYTNAVVVYFVDGTNALLSLRIGQSGSKFYLYYYDPTSFIWKKISTNSIDFNEDDFSVSNDTVSLNPSQRIFTGTQAEWEALTTEEKANYTVVNFPDDDSPEEFDTRLSAVEDVIPSGASASNQLVAQNATARLLNATYQGAGTSQRVVKLTLPSSVCGKFHVVCETGGQTSLRDFIIQTTTRTPFVNVYNLGSRTDYIVKKANGNEIYINVPTSDGSVLIYQEDANADGYGNLYTVTLTTTTVNDEAFINAETVTPVNLHPTSSAISGSTAPITSGGVANEINPTLTATFTAESGIKSGGVTVQGCKKIGDGLAVVTGYINKNTVLTVNDAQSNIGGLGITGHTSVGTNPTSLFLWSQGTTPQCVSSVWKTTGGWIAVPWEGGDYTLSEDAWFNAIVRYQ